MYLINPKIVKSIANEIYREAGFHLDDIEGWYTVYDSEATDHYVEFSANRDEADEMYEFKHFTICFHEHNNGENHYSYYSTNTLNRRELADKILEIIPIYFKEVTA